MTTTRADTLERRTTVRTLPVPTTVRALPVRTEVSGTLPEQALADLPGLYGGHHWSTSRTSLSYAYRYLAVGDGTLTLRRWRMCGRLSGEADVGHDYVVLALVGGTTTLDPGRDPQRVAIGTPVLLPARRRFAFEAVDHDHRLVHVNQAFVHAVAAEQLGVGGGVRLVADRQSPPGPAAVQRWRSALESASATLGEDGVTSLSWHEAARSTAAALLGLFPPIADPLPPALRYPRNARVRRAVEFIDEHAGEPLMLPDIAEEAGLSVRAVQEAFQRHFGTTPMAHLRDVRLHRVRQDLLGQVLETTTVAAVARQWGFGHLGRFSHEYFLRFGEYPRHTLRRTH